MGEIKDGRDLKGSPVQILEACDGHLFQLNAERLEKILLQPQFADVEVAVISVVGAFRKGKSFLLNFILRYFNNLDQNYNDWLSQPDDSLDGFSWRGGCERETSGIIIWSEPFLVTNERTGQKVAVLLLDTQGTFDSESTMRDCATVFALSSMVSSIQVYNLSQNIQEDDLQHLQLFTDYGRLALEKNYNTPFQSLIFLVRDWSFPYEAEYGFLGGQRILDRRLEIKKNQHQELQKLRQHIRSCFDQIKCFLLPHPGLKVSTNPHFKGHLGDIEPEFIQQVRSFVPKLCSEENLVLKKINGSPVTCRELLEYFKAYSELFRGDTLPEPKSLLAATAEANNHAAMASAKALYDAQMEKLCGGDAPYMEPQELLQEHTLLTEEALLQFKATKKMGGDEFSEKFLLQLQDYLKDRYEQFIKNNANKMGQRWITILTILSLALVFYLGMTIFDTINVQTFVQTCRLLFWIMVSIFVFWIYSLWSGACRDQRAVIDSVSKELYYNVFTPMAFESAKKVVDIKKALNDQQPSTSGRSVKKQN